MKNVKRMVVMISPEMQDEIKRLAQIEERSPSSMTRLLLKQALQNYANAQEYHSS